MYKTTLSPSGSFDGWKMVLDSPDAGIMGWHCRQGQLKCGMPLFPAIAVGTLQDDSVVIRTEPEVTQDVTDPVIQAVVEAVKAGTPVGIGLRPMEGNPELFQLVIASTTAKRVEALVRRASEIHDKQFN
jgi:citrate lyase gamma subunit